MRISTSILIATAGLFCVGLSGCLLSHSNHTVLRQGEPLRSLTFESENARTVYEASAKTALEDTSNESRGSLGIPFIVGLQRSKKTAPNAIRNDVATRFDLNDDQHISEYEASLQQKDLKR